MRAAKEQLGHLLVLVAERQWTPLALALADLLLSWPADYPDAMRPPMQALFETALREAETTTVAEIAPRFAGRGDLPVKVLNAFYLSAPAAMRREILLRNGMEPETAEFQPADGAMILAAARNGVRDFLSAFATGAKLPRKTASLILSDASGEALAVLCRGAGLNQASFSAIALLKGPRDLPLSVFDTVGEKAAAHLVADWRRTVTPPLQAHFQAAE